MRDTPLEGERRYRAMLMELSPEERARAGFEMFDFARACARASLLARRPTMSAVEVELGLLHRIYADLDATTLDWLEERIRRRDTTAVEQPP